MRSRSRRVDRHDTGVTVRTADEHRRGGVRQMNVIGELAPAGDETWILARLIDAPNARVGEATAIGSPPIPTDKPAIGADGLFPNATRGTALAVPGVGYAPTPVPTAIVSAPLRIVAPAAFTASTMFW